jgi:hypothetical protein
VGAALWDIAGSRRRLPWWTAAAFLALFVGRALPLPAEADGIATVMFFAAVALLAALPRRRRLVDPQPGYS